MSLCANLNVDFALNLVNTDTRNKKERWGWFSAREPANLEDED